MKTQIFHLICCFALVQLILAQADSVKLSDAQGNELLSMIHIINHVTLPYRTSVMEQMLAEANYFSDRLNLPTSHPIQMKDVRYPIVFSPWYSTMKETMPPYLPATIFGIDICNTNIPREQRLSALKIVVSGVIDTTNFEFGFLNGKLSHVMRLSEHDVEYYAKDLDKLVGKPSLIDTNGAYQLATQWLAAVDVDMAALNKLKWTVNQLHYRAHGATNYVTLPLYYVDFGNKHYPASGNLHAFDEPLLSVEILGTTKELQDLTINDLSFSRRPLLLITNALDLIRTPNPPLMQLQRPPEFQTNALGKP